jgi:hypothetical protein
MSLIVVVQFPLARQRKARNKRIQRANVTQL